MFKGFPLCSHVVAVAEVNGDLPVFLKCIQKGCKPHLSAIANQGLPCGSGRKGGVSKRKRKCTTPTESCSVRQSPTNDDILSHFTVGTQSDSSSAYSFSVVSPTATNALPVVTGTGAPSHA